MKPKGSLFLFLFIIGLAILLLPDNGKRVFTLNELHGPSLQDLAGLILMFIGWLYACIVVVRNAGYLIKKLGRGLFTGMLFMYALTIAGIGFWIGRTNDALLWMFVGVATFINALFIVLVFSPGQEDRRG